MDNSKSIPLSEVPGALEAGIKWLHCSGARTKADALRMAERYIVHAKAMRAKIKRLKA